MRCGRKLEIVWVESTDLEPETESANKSNFHTAWQLVCKADGILVPGGFGSRGIEGMIAAAKWARENKVPYLGVCLGLQIAVIEFVRNVLGKKEASSIEFDPELTEENQAVVYMPEIDRERLGGTMRLGLRPTVFQEDSESSKIRKLYGDSAEVFERHRHRYEVNPKLMEEISNNGLKFVGKDEAGERCEIFELDDHPFYVATQYHPEYISKVLDPSRPFLGLIAAASGKLDEVLRMDLKQRSNDF